MARVLRGGVYWADLNPVRGREQGGVRPVLVISHDVFNGRSGTVIAVALMSRSQRAGFPLTLKMEKTELPEPSWIKLSQIRTLSTERLGWRLATVTAEELEQVIEGLLELIA